MKWSVQGEKDQTAFCVTSTIVNNVDPLNRKIIKSRKQNNGHVVKDIITSPLRPTKRDCRCESPIILTSVQYFRLIISTTSGDSYEKNE